MAFFKLHTKLEQLIVDEQEWILSYCL